MADELRVQAVVEVVALHPADAERAEEGGADRLHVCSFDGEQARSVEPGVVSEIVAATRLPVRVTLRLSPGFTTMGGEFTRLQGLVTDYLSLGVEGFVFGFLTPDLGIDLEVCAALADSLVGAPWTFDRSFDAALDTRRAWRGIHGLPGLDRVHTAGAALGVQSGLDDLLEFARADSEFAAAAMASDGVRAEQVPWLTRAGITQVHLGAAVRPGRSWSKSYVDAGFVRSWRLLMDDALGRMSPDANGAP